MKSRHRVLALLFLLSVITYIDRVCISVAGPRMQKDLGMSPDLWGWVVGIFAISYAALGAPVGQLGDKIGARGVLAVIVIWWSLFTSLTGAVSAFGVLLVVRFLFGAGEAGAFPVSASAISRWFPVAERARSTGIMWMASRVGGALSPVLVIPIQLKWGWRASFWAFGIVGLFWSWAWWAWYRNSPSEKRGVSREELEEITASAAGVPPKEKLPWGQLLAKRQFWVLLAMYHTYCWGAYFFLSWLHTFLAKGRGFSDEELARYSWLPFVFGGLANLAGGVASDYLVKKWGLKWGRRAVGGFGLSFAAGFTIAAALIHHKIACVVLLSFAFGASDFMLPVSWAVCLDVGRRHAGAISGAMNTAGQVGAFLSSVAFGYLVRTFNSYDAPLLVMGSAVFISALLFFYVDPTRELLPAEAGAARQHG